MTQILTLIGLLVEFARDKGAVQSAAESTRAVGVGAVPNAAIEDGGYIVANTYTLADISWSPTVTTLISGGFDFSPYPEVELWYETILGRPQYQEAVIKWRNKATWAAGIDPTISGPTPVT